MNPGVVVGALVDRVAGEPAPAVHPVVWFGRYAAWLESWMYAPRRRRGVVFVAASLVPVVGASLGLRRLVGRTAAAALAGSIAIAARMLTDEATAVAGHLDRGDVDAASDRAQGLVGRDLTDAPPEEIARAVVESIAENSVDASVATLWWGTMAGAPGAFVHRAANTLDAMVGHRSERYLRFGWAAARLDDALNFVPARLAAITVALVVPRRARAIVHTVVRDAPAHPSPNAGVVEAAYAAALGIRLGGTNRYGDTVERRPDLGSGPPPSTDDIGRAVDLARRVDAVIVAALALLAVLRLVARVRPGGVRDGGVARRAATRGRRCAR